MTHSIVLKSALVACSLSLFVGCSSLPQKVVSKKRAAASHRIVGKFREEIRTELSVLKGTAAPVAKPAPTVATAAPAVAAPVPSIQKSLIALARTPRNVKSASMPGALSAGEIKSKMQNQVPTLAGNSDVGASESSTPASENLIAMDDLETSDIQLSKPNETPLIFDIHVTYNERVRQWIRYFQTEGRSSFRTWLERSSRYLPLIQYELTRAGLPLDLGYVAMIESGFQSHASSHAGALGLWQFISATGVRYGLHGDWWIDERRDFYKSTKAAIRYMSDLNKQFDSWYLVAASYNMGENGVRRLIAKRRTNNFWELADMGALPNETRDYVPKIIAATLISKAPALYGFRDLNYQMPLSYESIAVPGGTDLINLAGFLGVSEKYLKDLNPELIKGFIPRSIRSHRIRIPKGSLATVSQYIRQQTISSTN